MLALGLVFIGTVVLVGLGFHLLERRAIEADNRAEIKRENMRRIAKLRLR